jgi:hypothetical protein
MKCVKLSCAATAAVLLLACCLTAGGGSPLYAVVPADEAAQVFGGDPQPVTCHNTEYKYVCSSTCNYNWQWTWSADPWKPYAEDVGALPCADVLYCTTPFTNPNKKCAVYDIIIEP